VTAPADPGPPQQLDEEAAARVARARATLSQLGLTLQRRPLDPMVHDALRAYLATDTAPALACLDALRQLAARRPEILRDQIGRLTAYAAERVLR
jgi:hypothetical protein